MTQDETLDYALKAGQQRLYPRITNPNWLILRRRREIFRSWLLRLQLQNPKVLDVGGRIQTYRELVVLPHQYWSIDLCPTVLVSAVANAERLPFADNSFDLVLCTQMIQYAVDPAIVAQEIHRVLRPNGVLLLSAPSIFPRDSQHDRWRFWPAALKDLLGGFSDVEIVPECGSAAGFLRTMAVFCHMAARYRALRFVESYSFVPLINALGAAFEKAMGVRDGSFTANYSVMAWK
jgi:SAM-dependent methyltransferase